MEKRVTITIVTLLLVFLVTAGILIQLSDGGMISLTGKSIFSDLFAKLIGKDPKAEKVKTPTGLQEGVIPSETDLEGREIPAPPKMEAEVELGSTPGAEEMKELEADISEIRGPMCKDSDRGKFYFDRGAVTDFSPLYDSTCREAMIQCFDLCNHDPTACAMCIRLFPDWCMPYTVIDFCPGQTSTTIPIQLIEFYCNHDKIDYVFYVCPEACWNGECVSLDELTG
ncbi:MAG: hypothetical protein ABIB71_03135 [Candidatus Woesearchaeota archaeon]